MSHVTSIVLSCALDDEGIEAVNTWLMETASRGSLALVNDHAGGHKAMQVDVYAGAFNYLDDDAFLRAVSQAPWQYPESVSLFINGEHDDAMHQVDIGKNLFVKAQDTVL